MRQWRGDSETVTGTFVIATIKPCVCRQRVHRLHDVVYADDPEQLVFAATICTEGYQQLLFRHVTVDGFVQCNDNRSVRLFFIGFNLMTVWVMMNILTSIILDTYSYYHDLEDNRVTKIPVRIPCLSGCSTGRSDLQPFAE